MKTLEAIENPENEEIPFEFYKISKEEIKNNPPVITATTPCLNKDMTKEEH